MDRAGTRALNTADGDKVLPSVPRALAAAVAACLAIAACGDRVAVSKVLVSGLPEASGARPAGAKTRQLISKEIDRARGYSLRAEAKEGWTLKVDVHRVTDGAAGREAAVTGDPPTIDIKLQRYDQAGALDQYAAAVAIEADDVKLARAGGVAEERVAALVGRGLLLLRAQMEFRRMDRQALIRELAGRETWRREFSVEELGRRGDKAAAPQLVLKLKDPERAVAHKAVGALVAFGDRSVVPAFIDYAKGKEPATQVQMIYAISQLGGMVAEGYLFVLSTGHADPQIAHAAKEAYDELLAKKGKGTLRRFAVP